MVQVSLSILILGCLALACVGGYAWVLRREMMRVRRALEILRDSPDVDSAYTALHPAQDPLGIQRALITVLDRLKLVSPVSGTPLDERAVLESMSEGVLVFDSRAMLKTLNAAAARVLGLHPDASIGSALEEIIRISELQRFVSHVLNNPGEHEADITIPARDERYLQASGRQLRAFDGTVQGAVIVLNDVTRIRRLERARRDFVANVSHELKTPVTAIRGFVETLLEGALEDRATTERFLGIIHRQSHRLSQIFEDMLTLSRIEGQEEELEVTDSDLSQIARHALQGFEMLARDKELTLSFKGSHSVRMRLNAALMEQAISNLIDNAVKYAPQRSEVIVEVRSSSETVVLSVTDSGQGIETRHLPRLFERFYRIDKGRSRAEGGTGLGLAIVKHIAQAHGGSVNVESTVGVGSRFEIILPARAEITKVNKVVG